MSDSTKTFPEPAAGSGGDTAPGQGGILRPAMIGLVLGVDAIGHCVALATLFFAGSLIGGLGIATAAFLGSSALITLVLTRFSAFRNGIGIAQDTSIAILAPAAGYAASQAMGGNTAQIATALAVIGAATLLSGLTFLAVGSLGLGRIVRLVPYPVASGFLASSGYLLVLAALMILTETGSLSDAVAQLGERPVLIGVLPAVALAAALTLAVRMGLGSVAVLAVILATILLFYLVLAASGIGVDGARAMGLLPVLGQEGGQQISLALILTQIDWTAVLTTAPILAAVVLINLIGLLLNLSGVELAARRDIDVNRELRLTGLANLAIGAFGGSTGYITSGSTAVAMRLGIDSRALGLSYALVVIIGCFMASAIVAAVPVFVAAGLLVFIGVSMLEDWLLATRHRLMPGDWLIVLGIVILTAIFGILPAIGLGLGLAVLAFAVGYARLPVVRLASDARQRRSTLDRPPAEDEVLLAQGGKIRILQLQGYLFFGSVEQLIDRLRSEMARTKDATGPGAALILDFSQVSGLDSAGCAAIGKLGYVAHVLGVAVHLVAVPQIVLATMRRWDLDLSARSGLQLWSDLDGALESCENRVITAALGADRSQDLGDMLDSLGRLHPRTRDLINLMELIDLTQGQRLIQQGSRSGDVFFLESGRLAVVVESATGQRMRLRSMAQGAVVGEVARYRDHLRSADVVAEAPSRVYRLAEAVFDRIEREDRDLAALIHAVLARALSDKVVRTNRLVAEANAPAMPGPDPKG